MSERPGSIEHVLAGLSEEQRDAIRRFRAGRGRAPEHRPAYTPNPDPTEAELAVLILIAAGRTQAQTAVDLHLGIETIKSHMKSVRSKFGVRTAAGAVAVGFRRKILE